MNIRDYIKFTNANQLHYLATAESDRPHVTVIFVLFIILITGAGCRNSAINVSDSFDRPGLSRIWSNDRMDKQSFEIQSQVVRHGSGAAKITLRTGDTPEPSIDGDKPTERDELREASSLVSVEDKLYDFKFSMFLPDTFPVVPVRLVIAQWKEYCGKDSCSNDSPVVALRYVSDTLQITLQTEKHHRVVLYSLSDIRNRWLDFDFLIKFTRKSNGILIASINGQKIVNYSGVTSYPQERGYHLDKNRYYFKMGLYRDVMPQPMCIYIDDYSKREIR